MQSHWENMLNIPKHGSATGIFSICAKLKNPFLPFPEHYIQETTKTSPD